MARGKAEDAGGLTPVKDNCTAVGGFAALRMRRPLCGDNAAMHHVTRRTCGVGPNYDNTYANDYRDLSALKRLADAHEIAILLIHHSLLGDGIDLVNQNAGRCML